MLNHLPRSLLSTSPRCAENQVLVEEEKHTQTAGKSNIIHCSDSEKTSSNLRLLCPHVANLPLSDPCLCGCGCRSPSLQVRDAVGGFALPEGAHLTDKAPSHP
ncbi:hypothetical protein F2P79_012171 [Pimephales promelas]|nr:hypothetical protein F2P79_012171 [Pimephales promelas]